MWVVEGRRVKVGLSPMSPNILYDWDKQVIFPLTFHDRGSNNIL